MRDPALQERVLAREGHELRVIGALVHGAREHRHVGERRVQVDILEGAPTDHLRRHLTREREHGRAVDLRVVETCEQVGGTRARDREAGRELAGELPVGRRRERGRTLVPDTDERELTARLRLAHRVGETEVRVTDHPEHVGDTPRDHRLDHHVGDGARAWQLGGQPDVDAVVARLDRIRLGRVAKSRRRLPVDRVVVVAVPRATEPALLDRPFA